MNKLAEQAQKLPELLMAAQQQLTKMAHQNVELAKERDAAVHELRVVKMAQRMEERRIQPARSLEEKVAELRGLSPDKLAHVEHAIELTAGGFTLGSLVESDDRPTEVSGGSSDPLAEFVLNQAAYGG